jgi:hypothetical protein
MAGASICRQTHRRLVAFAGALLFATGLLASVAPAALGAAPALGASCVVTCSAINMTYHGGPVVSAPKIELIFYTESTSGDDSLSAMVTAIGSSTWWSRLSEFDTNIAGGTDQTITAPTALSEVEIAGTPPTTVNDGSLQTQLSANITGSTPAWGAPTLDSHNYDETIYVLIYPPGTTVEVNGEYSDESFCAYHSSVTVTVDTKSVSVPYIVLPTAGTDEVSDCGDSADPGYTQAEVIQSLASEQLAETVTDPDPAGDTAWYDVTNGLEVGSACATGHDDTGMVSGYPLQDLWSNVDDDCALSVPGPFTNLALVAASASIQAGTADSFRATGADSGGDLFSDETAPTSFTISPDGAGTGASCTAKDCTATEAGIYTVTGTDGTRTGQTEMTVTPAASSALVLSPASASILAGARQTFTAAAVDAYGNVTGASTSGTTYAVSPDTAGTGASCGADSCTATKPGTYTVTGTDGSIHGSTTLVVEPAAGKVSNVTDTVSGATAYVNVSCAGSAGVVCDLQLTLTASETKSGGEVADATARTKTRTVVIGTETVKVKAGKRVKVKLSLNATGKRLLRQKRHLSAKLAIVEKVSGRSVKITTKTLRFR